MPFHEAVGVNGKKGATTEIQGAGVKYMGYPIKYYSSVSGGLRETKAAIGVHGSIWYRGYGSVKSTVLFLNFPHIIQLDILRPSSRENHH